MNAKKNIGVKIALYSGCGIIVLSIVGLILWWLFGHIYFLQIYYLPESGIWETPDHSIYINADSVSDCYINIQGNHVSCTLINDRGDSCCFFYANETIPNICKEGKEVLRGQTIKLNDNEWVLRVDGVDHLLHQSGQSGDG